MLAISSSKGRGLSPVQLQKVLFLLGKELPLVVGGDFYQFEPYNYGPFDKGVYQDAEGLSYAGYVSISNSGRLTEYSATPEGLKYAEEIRARAPQRGIEYLGKIVGWAQSLSFSALVRAIYQKYPEYRANSVFQG
jgi:uncharacterized protein YwgA